METVQSHINIFWLPFDTFCLARNELDLFFTAQENIAHLSLLFAFIWSTMK